VILALKARGHVVGYIGDGINDAPSLHTADVGISVMNGVEVAKDAAKIILLEKDLSVLNEGVIEGRRCFANIMKYIVMGTSSNFGNMFSMAAASLFLPMLPTQILLNNFLYDVSQLSIPGDNVDPALLRQPKRWQIGFIRQFMMIIGPISSLYDFLTFRDPALGVPGVHQRAALPHRLVRGIPGDPNPRRIRHPHGRQPVPEPSERAVADQRRRRRVDRGRPALHAAGDSALVDRLPASLLSAIAVLAITYLALVQVIKTWFYRRHALL
jgi:P-type Mg2+ transporter